jgi:hypothetical protein
MDGTPVVNKRPTTQPFKVSLADSRQVMSTHICDIYIKGLPFVLTGHIIPGLSIASLLGIRLLTKAGCEVTFTRDKCIVCYKNDFILRGEKDPETNFWTLPLDHQACLPSTPSMYYRRRPLLLPTPMPILPRKSPFSHTVRNKANSICFAHQFLCSPRISTLLKAI